MTHRLGDINLSRNSDIILMWQGKFISVYVTQIEHHGIIFLFKSYQSII